MFNLSIFVIISLLFSFSWKHETLPLPPYVMVLCLVKIILLMGSNLWGYPLIFHSGLSAKSESTLSLSPCTNVQMSNVSIRKSQISVSVWFHCPNCIVLMCVTLGLCTLGDVSVSYGKQVTAFPLDTRLHSSCFLVRITVYVQVFFFYVVNIFY